MPLWPTRLLGRIPAFRPASLMASGRQGAVTASSSPSSGNWRENVTPGGMLGAGSRTRGQSHHEEHASPGGQCRWTMPPGRGSSVSPGRRRWGERTGLQRDGIRRWGPQARNWAT